MLNCSLQKDTIIVPFNGYMYLYSFASKKAAKVRKDEYNEKLLSSCGFFNDIPVVQKKNEVGPLFLLLTRDCPLRCIYCYANAGLKKEAMSLHIAESAVEAYLNLEPALPNVRFGGGGEPTLEKNLITFLIRKYKNKNIAWSMITSGVTDERFLRWLIEEKVNITFSLDGPPEIQDLHRPLKSNKGSSNIAERSCLIYRKERNKLHIRCTLSSVSIRNLNQILDYFSNLGVTMLSIEPMYPMGRGRSAINSWFIPSPKETLNALLKTLEWGKRTGVVVRTIALFHPSFVTDLTYCGPINGTAYVVNHQGYLLACGEALDTDHPFWNIWVIGRLVNNRFEINEEKLKWLISYTTVESMTECQSCFAKYVCRGGCPMRRLFQTGKINKPDPYHCFISRNLLAAVIIRMVEGEYPDLNQMLIEQ